MTGSSCFHRQSSVTLGEKCATTLQRPKLRRYSSADEQSSMMPIPDNQYQHKDLGKMEKLNLVDSDSGAEDLSQPDVLPIVSHVKTGDADELLSNFSSCEDGDHDDHILADQEFAGASTMCSAYSLEDYYQLAKQLPNEEKKHCGNAMVIFHAEFALNVLIPMRLIDSRNNYCLFAESDFSVDPCYWQGFWYCRVDNAKAQFKCEACKRSWTSMRSRIVFKISIPQPNAFVVLKIFGQNCEDCQILTQPLWYMEEVCRVVKNLGVDMLNTFYPDHLNRIYGSSDGQQFQASVQSSRKLPHDPNQRKGKMNRPHDSNKCEACFHGLCFPR